MMSRSPFGEMKYNWAEMTSDGKCIPQEEDLPPPWRLYFLVPDLTGYYLPNPDVSSTRAPPSSTPGPFGSPIAVSNTRAPPAIYATTPWGNRTCVIAKPRFDRHLDPCTRS